MTLSEMYERSCELSSFHRAVIKKVAQINRDGCIRTDNSQFIAALKEAARSRSEKQKAF